MRVRSLGRQDPRWRKWQCSPVFLPGKFHGQKRLVSYSPLGSQRVRHGWARRRTTWFPKPKVFPSCPFQKKFASSALGHRSLFPVQSSLSRGGLPWSRDFVFSPATTLPPPTPQPPPLPSMLFHHSAEHLMYRSVLHMCLSTSSHQNTNSTRAGCFVCCCVLCCIPGSRMLSGTEETLSKWLMDSQDLHWLIHHEDKTPQVPPFLESPL